MDVMKRQKDMTPDEPPQVGRCLICCWGRVEGNYEQLQNEAAVSKWEQHSPVDISGGEVKSDDVKNNVA